MHVPDNGNAYDNSLTPDIFRPFHEIKCPIFILLGHAFFTLLGIEIMFSMA